MIGMSSYVNDVFVYCRSVKFYYIHMIKSVVKFDNCKQDGNYLSNSSNNNKNKCLALFHHPHGLNKTVRKVTI